MDADYLERLHQMTTEQLEAEMARVRRRLAHIAAWFLAAMGALSYAFIAAMWVDSHVPLALVLNAITVAGFAYQYRQVALHR